MRVYSATDVGQRRKMNQDYVFVSENPVGNLPNLFVVADGMGGHNAGDYASSHAVQTLVDEIRRDADFNPIKVIRHAIETANTEILDRSRSDENLRGMGTTMVVCTIVGHYAYVANVGDSRLYVVQGEIHQVTKDHSLVQEMRRIERIPAILFRLLRLLSQKSLYLAEQVVDLLIVIFYVKVIHARCSFLRSSEAPPSAKFIQNDTLLYQIFTVL